MLIGAAPQTRLVADFFARKGRPEDEARRINASLVGAKLAGHDSHGIVRVPRYAQYVDWVKSTRSAMPGSEVPLPGEPGWVSREQRPTEGVPLPDATWNAILDTARKAGLSQAEIGRY